MPNVFVWPILKKMTLFIFRQNEAAKEFEEKHKQDIEKVKQIELEE